MLLHNLFTKTLRDLRWPTFWVALALALGGAYFVALYPEYAKVLDIQGMLDKLPESVRQLMAGTEIDASSATGFLNIELFPLILPALLVGFAVALCSGFTAGEESRGTIDVLLSYPIRRWRVIVDKCAALVLAVALTAVLMLLGIQLGSIAGNSPVETGNVAAGLLLGSLVALDFGAMALAIAAGTGNRAAAAGVPIGLLVVMYLVQTLGATIEFLRSINWLSLFHYYLGDAPLKHGLNLGDAAVLGAVALAFAALSLVLFERRDLAA